MTGLTEPAWLILARDWIGLREIKGAAHEGAILKMAEDAHLSWIRDDETPWCSIFVCAMIERAGLMSTRSAAARSWAGWGLDVRNPDEAADIPLGAIIVYSRGSNPHQGHVGFAVGVNPDGHILTLGGNQMDQVSIAAFHPGRIVALRWPIEHRADMRLLKRIPFMGARAPLSTNEA